MRCCGRTHSIPKGSRARCGNSSPTPSMHTPCAPGCPRLTHCRPLAFQTTGSRRAETADRPMISVVVCTRNRPQSLLATLRSLTAMSYRPFEVVVVDNAPSSEATREAVLAEYGGDPRVRYVREPRPGLSCARNRGIEEAAADIVAFTDDDVIVDRLVAGRHLARLSGRTGGGVRHRPDCYRPDRELRRSCISTSVRGGEPFVSSGFST